MMFIEKKIKDVLGDDVADGKTQNTNKQLNNEISKI